VDSTHQLEQYSTVLLARLSLPLSLSLSGFPSDGPLVCALEQERRFRLPPKPPPPPQPVHGGQRLEAALSCPHLLRYPRQHLISSLAGAEGLKAKGCRRLSCLG
jgi:hypothetical protein